MTALLAGSWRWSGSNIAVRADLGRSQVLNHKATSMYDTDISPVVVPYLQNSKLD